MAQELKLQPNKPVQLNLRYNFPKIITGCGKRLRAMFTLEDRRVFFCDVETAGRITRLGAKPGEPIWIALKWSGEPGAKAELDVWLDPSVEYRKLRRNTEPMCPAPAPLEALPDQTTPNIHQFASVSDPIADSKRCQAESWTRYLKRTTIALTDVYAECVKEARKHGETVSPEDVRSILLSAFIAATRRPPRKIRRVA